MKNLKIFFVFIFASIIFIFLNTLFVRRNFARRTKIALQDHSMLPDDTEVKDKVIVGRGDDKYRPSAISLICTNQNDILLLVQDYRPTRHGKAGGLGEGSFGGSNLTASNHKKTKISNMTYLYRGYFDVYVSDSLVEEEIASILSILNIEDIATVKINAFDGGNVFVAEFDLLKVKKLINNCQL